MKMLPWKKLSCLLAVPAIIFSASVVSAEVIDADSTITSVVVYVDRALVTRTAEIQLEAGEHTVVFGDLPANMDTNSLRARGEGTTSVLILSLESKTVILDRPREKNLAKLEDEMQKVNDALSEVKTHGDNLTAELALVRSIGVYSGEQFSKEFITRQPGLDEWNAMVEFQRNNVTRLSGEINDVKLQKRDLTTQKNKLTRQIAQIRARSERSGLEVKVSISARSAGKFALSLSSVIHGARWYPTYDARADLKAEKVKITYIGNVRQNTGEDWSDVDISLSTARPAVGAKMPELRPWIIQPQPIRKTSGGRILRRLGGDQVDRFLISDLEEYKMVGAKKKEAPRKPAEDITADIVQHETSAQFKIPRKMDVPSDNAFHRVTILSKKLPTEFSYSATPMLSPFAYLSAKITNKTGAQWLRGKVSVFVDGDFIGTSHIAPVAKDEEITLDLGIDESITIEREKLVRLDDETLIFGKKKRTFKDRISVENHKSREVELTVIDRIPVAGHKDIKISDVKFSKKPTERDDDKGIVKWKLRLKPAEKKEITIEFMVTHPKDMAVTGL